MASGEMSSSCPELGLGCSTSNDNLQKPDPLVIQMAIKLTIEQFKDLELFTSSVNPGKHTIIIWRKEHVYYPRPDSSDIALAEISDSEWTEFNCVVHPVRIVFSTSTLKASLQVFGYEIDTISPVIELQTRSVDSSEATSNIWVVHKDLLNLIKKTTEYGNYRLCEGFTYNELNLSTTGSNKPYSLVTKYMPFFRLESPKCCRLIEPGKCKANIFCQECRIWKNNQMTKNKLKRKAIDRNCENSSPPRKICKTAVNSTFKIALLTPRSRSVRIKNICQSRRVLMGTVSNLRLKLKKTLIKLSKEQSNEMTSIVSTINSEFKDDLNTVLNNGSDHQTNRKLRQIWNQDRQAVHLKQTNEFFNDQRRNKTGHRGNVWSTITYRIALAVFIRSNAAYKALKSFNILQLPSEESLRDFTSERLQESGINHKYLQDRQDLYQKIKEEQLSKGFSKPIGEGVIIYDEVRVISKIMWNSSNNKLSGLAMKPSEYESLTDIYEYLQADDEDKPTNYVLQFYWRDVSYSFDVVGPYISSCGPVKKDILMGCLLDVIRTFEAYDFHVRAVVCDGASTNLSLLKAFMGTTGPFGHDANESDPFDRHKIDPSFRHPFRPFHRIFFIICPSHQLKNMVAALHSSRQGGTKSFEKDGIFFGWSAIQQVYDEDVKRAACGTAKRVKGLLKSYVIQDCWTRLNVKPAKIMQQQDMLSALHQIANPNNGNKPLHYLEIESTRDFLIHCNMLFETGILDGTRKVSNDDETQLIRILQGYQYFVDWVNGLMNEDPAFDPKSKDQKKFISWQTWDLLRVMVFGFIGFTRSFMADYPERFILPIKINGSAIESLFGQMRFSTSGKLSGTNYSYAQRGLLIRYDVQGKKFSNDDHRKAPIAVAEMPLKRRKRKKN